MAITGKWYNEAQTIYYYEISGAWVTDEIIEAVYAGWEIIVAKPHKVDIIVDMTQCTDMSLSGFFRQGTKVFRNSPENVRYRIVVGTQPELLRRFRLFIRLNSLLPPVRMLRFVNTTDEALAFIHSLERGDERKFPSKREPPNF